MSCLCNNSCQIEITNQLESLAATLAKLEACLVDIAAKVGKLEGCVGDWVGSDEEEDMEFDDEEYDDDQ